MDGRQIVDRITDNLLSRLSQRHRVQILRLLDTMGLVKSVSRRTSTRQAVRGTSAKQVWRNTSVPGDKKMAARKEASQSNPPRRRLGRGLTSLISTPVPLSGEEQPTAEAPPPKGTAGTSAAVIEVSPMGQDQAPTVQTLPTAQIRPNSRQPRQNFDEGALKELGASIKSAGLMQPIVVRPDPAGGYELVVGERRWRAAQLIGLTSLPAVVRQVDDRTAAEWALIENIQRADLNPMERADAFRRLTAEHGLTHRQVADHVGLDRSTISNLLRLHELDEFTKDAIRNGMLSEAHGRALLSITNLEARRRLGELAIRQDWSLRNLQKRATSLAGPEKSRPKKSATAAAPHRADLQRRLSDHLGTKVQVLPGKQKGSGRLVIEFYSFDQFEGLMQKLGFSTAEL
ncbi:MAG: ParB/RepB/Spo0J family partition protein [Planctomycetota bacterium]|jgi:ParB family chromosome partitioning protein